MKLDGRKATYFRHLPADEADAVMAELEKAEAENDAQALKKCARLLLWLYKAFKGDACRNDEPFNFDGCEFESVRQFNAAWKKEAEKP
jgi:hypothetical protein